MVLRLSTTARGGAGLGFLFQDGIEEHAFARQSRITPRGPNDPSTFPSLSTKSATQACLDVRNITNILKILLHSSAKRWTLNAAGPVAEEALCDSVRSPIVLPVADQEETYRKVHLRPYLVTTQLLRRDT